MDATKVQVTLDATLEQYQTCSFSRVIATDHGKTLPAIQGRLPSVAGLSQQHSADRRTLDD